MNSNHARLILTICLLGVSGLREIRAETKTMYEPTRESLQNYEVPEWYQDAKFGIWPHWGIYSVPAYRGDHAAEWYGRWIYCIEKEPETVPLSPKQRWNDYFDLLALKTAAHHRETYGDPRDFGYHEFAGQFKAEQWDPAAWAQMAVDAGAKFFCMMGMHHDGFALYDSDLTRWNAVDMGPKRNLVGEMARAARDRGLKFGVSNHFAWNYEFFGFYHRNGFAGGEEELADFYSRGVVDEAYLDRWWRRTTELVDKAQPDLYYFDWGWHGEPWCERHLHEKFAAYLYNRGIDWGRGTYGRPGVVLNSKFGRMSSYCVRDLERRQMTDIQEDVWQTDTSISVHSWGYSTEDEYRSADQLLDSLIDIVSKNGVMMLNFGPRADGTVPDEYREPLVEMGAWLKVNGEAIYATRPFSVYGEEPVGGHRGGGHDHELVFTGEHIRFTRSKDNTVLYPIALGWPGETMTLRSLASGRFDTQGIRSVRLLGTDKELDWTQNDEGLKVAMPPRPDYGMAYPLRIEFEGAIPALSGAK